MSKLKPQKEYEKTVSFKFFRWLKGTKDPYLGRMEMQPQGYAIEEELSITQRMEETQMVMNRVYDIEKNKEIKLFTLLYKIMSFVFCFILLGLLLVTVSNLPQTGNPNNPDNNEVPLRYIEQGLEETGAINLVTGMILQYRAFDTFGETHVLFIATCCVMILLASEKKREKETMLEKECVVQHDTILQTIAFILVPLIFILGIYIVLNGHLSPGGGFSGGATIGAGMILYTNAFGFIKTEKFFNEKIYKIIKVGALSLYAIVMSYYFFIGANGIKTVISLGIPGNIISAGLILPINIFVGLEVACTMYAFYALFRKGGM